jgi:preprotein translocase subunit SecA
MNKQREAIYAIRRDLLEGVDQREYLLELASDILLDLMEQYTPREKRHDEWDPEGFRISVGNQFGIDVSTLGIDVGAASYNELSEKLNGRLREIYEDKERRLSPANMRLQERFIMLQVLDSQWKDHLLALDHLKEGIGLRGYGQRDPLIEYKKESYDMFEAMNARREEETIRYLFLFEPISREEQDARAQEREEARRRRAREQNLVYSAGDSSSATTKKREAAKVGRNDPCPCGSGKKFKKCHGA